MDNYLKEYLQPSYILGGRLYHQLKFVFNGEKRYSKLFVCFETSRERKKGTTVGRGYTKIEIIQVVDPNPDTPWGSTSIETMMNYVGVRTLNTKQMNAPENRYGLSSMEDVQAAFEYVVDRFEDIDVEHLEETLIRNKEVAKKYADIIAEEIPDYLITQSLNAIGDDGITRWNNDF